MENQQFEELIYKANLSERAERFDDMAVHMEEIIKICRDEGREIDIKTRNLFSIAYKNLAGARRASWRILNGECERQDKTSNKYALAKGYIDVVVAELHKICDEVLLLIEDFILPMIKPDNVESMVFFLKMKADYYRYKAEVSSDAMLESCKSKSQEAYESATRAAMSLKSTSPVRLGLALNYSVFYYEILRKCEKACKLAKRAFDEAITELDSLSEDHYKDSTLIMQLLRDNLTLWTSQEEDLRDDETEDETNVGHN
ncbi:14-3-3 like protein [Astathelohania contejeani]|uniref:14-3-3 like protein n=1 Tax=Astathelohania contejeani TaxID=164912 RepID=A0ABQ7HWT0_9MICR|nr:14-3-3 like protein [Thelohania contejeani]